ncbi:hypothetical protein NDU88_001302 [Pleurodeles waltl]|uniref:Uncharacterized protein n=1 Tax=Pleurodeles waltl TaxID=8319 RepID=A0AAV7S8K3_PLEWA|nr:hypothetical protein NDU88_001302 [Pleurodeles waltl]
MAARPPECVSVCVEGGGVFQETEVQTSTQRAGIMAPERGQLPTAAAHSCPLGFIAPPPIRRGAQPYLVQQEGCTRVRKRHRRRREAPSRGVTGSSTAEGARTSCESRVPSARSAQPLLADTSVSPQSRLRSALCCH